MKIVKKEPSGANFIGMFIGAAIIDYFPLEGFMHQRIPLVTQKVNPRSSSHPTIRLRSN